MRILLATYWQLPHLGGVWTYVTLLGKCLERLGHEVEILAQHPDMTRYYLMKSGQTVAKNALIEEAEQAVTRDYAHCPEILTPWMFWRESEKYAFELACRQFLLDRYDVIHTQDIISTSVLSRVKPDGVPLVATIHGCLATEWVENDEIQYRSPIEQEYLALEEYFGAMSPNRLILPSRWLSNRLSSFQISHPDTQIIPYGINQKVFQESLQESDAAEVSEKEPGTRIIACPARLVAIKGQFYLLEAVAMIVKQRPEVVCWLLGDGVMKEDLKRQIRELGIEAHVKLLGRRTDVPQLLSAVDIVALPSLQDNQPFSIIEAQCAGKPVVASKVGGIVEMIEDGRNGFLVEPRNAQALQEKLLTLLEDEALRKRQSAEARALAGKMWDDEIMTKRTVHVYEKAVGNGDNKARTAKQDFINRLSDRFRHLRDSGKDRRSPAVTTVHGAIFEADTAVGIPDACLHLIDISGVVLRSVQTRRNGTFSFGGVQPGNYELCCSAAGFGRSTLKTSVSEAGPLALEIMLPVRQ